MQLSACIFALVNLFGIPADSVEFMKEEIKVASDSQKVHLYIDVAHYYKPNDPDNYKLYLDSALWTAEDSENLWCVADASIEQGVYWSNTGNFDKAIDFYQKAIIANRSVNNAHGLFKTNCNLGIIYVRTGKYEEATEQFFKALEYAEQKEDPDLIADCMGYLGHLNYYQKDFEQALKYHKLAKKSYLAISDLSEAAFCDINIGIAYEQLDNLDSAEYYYQQALDFTIVTKDEFTQSHCHNNLGQLYQIKNDHEKAIDHLNKGLVLRLKFKDTTGIAYGYSVIAYSYLEQKKYTEAIDLLEKSLELSVKMDFVELIKSSLLKLSEAYEAKANYSKALDYHQQALTISDTLLQRQKIEALTTARTKYETEKKEKEIELLTSEQQIKNLELRNTQYVTGAIGVTAILIIISIIALYNKRNFRLKVKLAKEKEVRQRLKFKTVIEAEEKERKRIAQELHDGLGQLLSTARLNISAAEDLPGASDTQHISNSIKLIDEAVDEVRSISHNMMPNALISIGFESALREQVHLINDAGQFSVHLELPDEALQMEESLAISLYRIVQEILNNALKYSEAKNIWLNIKPHQGVLNISVKDDGKGFDLSELHHGDGIGWESISSRIEIINGDIKIDSMPEKGTLVELKVAV